MFNFSTSLSAMNAFETSVQASAHNIANVNTNEFKSQVVHFESGPQDQGVRVSAIHTDPSPGPAIIDHIGIQNDRPVQDSSNYTDGPMNRYPMNGIIEGSNTELPREVVNLINMQSAHSANAVAIRTNEELMGSLLSMKV